jgi:hypothetical protein
MESKSQEPFNLPAGSVRALLTTLLVGITAAVMFIPVPSGKDDVKAMFVLLTGIAVRDYFSSRDRAHERERTQDAANASSAGIA